MGDLDPHRVLQRAVVLQTLDDEASADRKAHAEAAQELGITPETLAAAESDLRAQQARLTSQARTRRNWLWRTGAFGLLLALAVTGAVVVLDEPPVPPFTDELAEGANRWALTTNPGTAAAVRFANVPGHGQAAVVTVTRFQPDADGRFFANLETARGPAHWPTHGTVRFRLRGEGLATVRLFLEAGETRWRSAAVAVPGNWREVELPLASFERQERRGETWRVVGPGRPQEVLRMAWKFGQFMNPADARGEVWLDDLSVREDP